MVGSDVPLADFMSVFYIQQLFYILVEVRSGFQSIIMSMAACDLFLHLVCADDANDAYSPSRDASYAAADYGQEQGAPQSSLKRYGDENSLLKPAGGRPTSRQQLTRSEKLALLQNALGIQKFAV